MKQKKELLCCMIKDMDEEQQKQVIEVLSSDINFVVHNDDYIFYYPSNPPDVIEQTNTSDNSLWSCILVMAAAYSCAIGYIIGSLA